MILVFGKCFTRLQWRTRSAMSCPKRFGTIALKIEAGQPSENMLYILFDKMKYIGKDDILTTKYRAFLLFPTECNYRITSDTTVNSINKFTDFWLTESHAWEVNNCCWVLTNLMYHSAIFLIEHWFPMLGKYNKIKNGNDASA